MIPAIAVPVLPVVPIKMENAGIMAFADNLSWIPFKVQSILAKIIY